MKHKHVGPNDVACTGCFGEAQGGLLKGERRKTVLGLALLICLVIVAAAVVAYYLNKHGSHLR